MFIKILITRAALFFSFLFIALSSGYAAQTVDDLQRQAYASITRGNEVVDYAQRLMEGSPTTENAARCVDLYLEAALLYGNAARFFKAMGPNYVPQDVVDQFSTAERECLKTVDEIRRQLNKGQIVGTKKETMQSLLKKLQEMSP